MISLLFTGDSGDGSFLPIANSRASRRIENIELTVAAINKMRLPARLDGCIDVLLSVIGMGRS